MGGGVDWGGGSRGTWWGIRARRGRRGGWWWGLWGRWWGRWWGTGGRRWAWGHQTIAGSQLGVLQLLDCAGYSVNEVCSSVRGRSINKWTACISGVVAVHIGGHRHKEWAGRHVNSGTGGSVGELAGARASADALHKLTDVGGAHGLQVDLVRSAGVSQDVISATTDCHVREEVHVVGGNDTIHNVITQPDGVLNTVATDFGGDGVQTIIERVEREGNEQEVEVVAEDSNDTAEG
jgi:hypothetical protein